MAIILEAINVVIKHQSILEKYPNGELGFLGDVTVFNAPWHSDLKLSRVGFFDPNEMYPFLSRLEQRGLIFTDDFCIVDMVTGSTKPCNWFGFARQPFFKYGSKLGWSDENFSIGWLKNNANNSIECDEDGKYMLAVPSDWSLSNAIIDNRQSSESNTVNFTNNGTQIKVGKPDIWE